MTTHELAKLLLERSDEPISAPTFEPICIDLETGREAVILWTKE